MADPWTWANDEPDPEPPKLGRSVAEIVTTLDRLHPWRARAACRGRLDAFFPPAGRRTSGLEVCAECPVVRECREEALAYEAEAGAVEDVIRGGLSPKERRELVRERDRRGGHHGRAGYVA